jgi:hypothetical protein
MELLLGFLTDYGITLVGALICIVVTQTVKPFIPKKLVPYIPLIASIPITICTTFILPQGIVWSGELVKSGMIEWAKMWLLALGLFDLVIRLFKKVDEGAEDGTRN